MSQIVSPYSCLPPGVSFWETRADFQADPSNGGKQAPYFNVGSSLQDLAGFVRHWQLKDKSLLDANGNYNFLYPALNPDPKAIGAVLLPFTLPGSLAMSLPNLPGVPTVQSYAAWLMSRPATGSTYTGTGFGLIPQEALYYPAEADQLCTDIAAGLGVTASKIMLSGAEGNTGLIYNYAIGDPRRVWDVVVDGKPFAMGVFDFAAPNSGLWQERNRGGLWWPGKWVWTPDDKAAGVAPKFQGASFNNYGTLDTTQTLPVPIQLPAGASLVVAMGGSIGVQMPAPPPVDLDLLNSKLDRMIAGLVAAGYKV